MKNLVERECGVTNSLLKFSSHFTQDKGFKQDGFHDVIPFPAHKVDKPMVLPRDVEWADEFLQGQSIQAAPETFHMGSLLQEMRQIEEAELFHEPQTAPAIADLAVSSEWEKEFLNSEAKGEGQFGDQATHRADIVPMKWAGEYLEPADKKLWLNEFENELESGNAKLHDDVQRAAQELVDSLADPKTKKKEFMKLISDVAKNEPVEKDGQSILDTADEWALDFVSEQSAKSLVDQWQQEFAEVSGNEEISEETFWNKLQEHWEDVDRNANPDHPWLTEYTNKELYQNYEFASENPFLSQLNPFEAGLTKLKEGDIPNAVLLFESAVQKDHNHVEAWQYLGTTQAENEREPAAISALKKCLELQPDNLTAWMAIAVSYTNEYQQALACNALKSWLTHNPQYSHLVKDFEQSNASANVGTIASRHKMMEIRDQYIAAARLSPNQIDPDVQCGLGVLFNLSGDLDKAIDCFTAAVQVRPQDAQLWNKLGASLANSNKSEEAVEAYHQALKLAPGFIRSRYNLGIACINLGAHNSAVEHFLVALNLQQKSESQNPTLITSPGQSMSKNIWGTLRMTLTLMNRMDLHAACDSFDLNHLNKEFNMNT